MELQFMLSPEHQHTEPPNVPENLVHLVHSLYVPENLVHLVYSLNVPENLVQLVHSLNVPENLVHLVHGGGYLGDPDRAHRYFNKNHNFICILYFYAPAPGTQWSRRDSLYLLIYTFKAYSMWKYGVKLLIHLLWELYSNVYLILTVMRK